MHTRPVADSKILALVLAMLLVLSMTAAFAQEKAYTGEGKADATITISNAAKGETYSVVKLFGATVGDAVGGSTPIAYTGDIPEELNGIFEKSSTTGAITVKAGHDPLTADDTALLKTWAKKQEALISETANGTALSFTDLPYGYYVVLTTQGAGAVSVTSIKPDATITDKNTTEPDLKKWVKNDAGQWVKNINANIAEAREFKLDITTTNWHSPVGGGDQKQVRQYVIGDDFDTNKFTLVSIDSIQVITKSGETETVQDTLTVASGATFPVTVAWATKDDIEKSDAAPTWTSKYPNGAIIRIVYKAKLNDDAQIDVYNSDPNLAGNVNTADLDWTYTDGDTHFGEDHEHIEDKASVDTYAVALKKFDKTGAALDGAKFQFPFYVKATKDTDGAYVYAGTTSGEGLINEIETPTDGQITIKGVKAAAITGIMETKAPDGYNKIDTPFSVTPVKISTTEQVTSTEKSWKIDADGNVFDLQETDPVTVTKTTYTNNDIAVTAIPVINLAGTTLPSTGGIGTTIFYVAGSILVLAAVIFLVTKRRMGSEE